MLLDIRYAIRQLVKHPGFTLGVALTLAFAIGANTAEFSLTRAIMEKPLPWPNANRLVMVWNTLPSIGWQEGPVAIPDYLDRRNKTDCFSDSALFSVISLNISSGSSAEHLTGLRVTPSYFSTLEAIPFRGRLFSTDDSTPHQDKVAIISYKLWQSRFSGQDSVLGTSVRMNGETYRIVGIMPKSFVAPNISMASIEEPNIQLWVPFAFTADEMSDKGRGNWQAFMIGRLKLGVTIDQAQAQIDAIYQTDADREKHSVAARKAGGFGGIVAGYREQNIRQIKPMILVLQVAVLLIFLIACANVANLLLVRAIARKKELAIRLALGSGKFRMARQLLTENVVLALIGGGLGILVGRWGLDLFGWIYDRPWLNRETTSVDGIALGFDLILSLGSALFFGLVTTISMSLREPGEVLRGENIRGSTGGSSAKTRAALITTEVALATMLLIAAGLTVKSFLKLLDERPGFTSDNILTAQVSLPETAYKDAAAISAFFDDALRRMRALPGVKSASVVSYAPLSGDFNTSDYHIKSDEHGKDEPDYNALIEAIDPEYFHSMQIPLLAGRTFSKAESPRGEPSVIIDQFLAKKRFAGRDPIGVQIRCSDGTAAGNEWRTIVGVVGDVKAAGLAQPILKETLYFPYSQRPQPRMTLVLRTETDPRSLVAPLRELVHQMDPDLPIFDVQTMDQRLAGSLSNFRLPMILFAMFGATALSLASLGLYGVLAYSVSQRTKEIGIRIALGAQNHAILRLIVRSGIRFTLLGIAVGLVAALGLTRLLDSLLFQVRSVDPFTYFAVPGLLCIVALLASYIPARRATRIDPMEALRSE
jgi:putative ABC transport system permease protein